MRALVTGATGFIGSHLTSKLIESGHKVRAFVRQTNDSSWLESIGAEIVHGSLIDLNAAQEACKDVDIVFNLAGRMGGYKSTEQEMRLVNVTAVETLLEACQKSEVQQFIHCSTPGVVGMVGIAPECMPYNPTGPYEHTKYEGERIALQYHDNGKVPVTVVCPDFVYGPGDLHKLKMFKAIQEGRFPIIGSGNSLIHPTYIDDIVSGFELVANNEAAYGEKFNFAGPRPVTIKELVTTIADKLNVKVTRLPIPVPAARLAAVGAEVAAKLVSKEPIVTLYQINFFTRDHASDISKAKQILGFQPQVDLQEGINRTIQWYKIQSHL